MGNFYNKIRSLLLPLRDKARMAIFSFSKREKIVFIIFCATLLVSALVLLEKVNRNFMVSIPEYGGTITEGVVGSPRFINPVLAYSSVDNDLVALCYSGLMRKNKDGELIPDLAERYEISKDGLTYTFTLKRNLSFQDGKPLTVEDIIFTIKMVKDPVIKSPKKANWDGINIEKVDDQTLRFTLSRPYSSFLENTTLGILPEHIWKNSRIEMSDYNVNPVGSGPYRVKSINKSSEGMVSDLKMKSFKNFALGKPYLSNINFNFYSNENDLVKALSSGDIDQASSIAPKNAEILKKDGFTIISSSLPRIFGLFFNQNQNQIFTDKNVVKAINLAIDKDAIINEVLLGYGTKINAPIPYSISSYQKLNREKSLGIEESKKEAIALLEKDGWKKGDDGFLVKADTGKKGGKNNKSEKVVKKGTPLYFSISTSNTPELAGTAEIIKRNLESIGIKVEVKTFEIGNLNQSVIRPRKYDALLFGEMINHESDLYAFWHSSQRNDPGQNVAMYTNSKVDKILEDVFSILDKNARMKKYAEFENEIQKDMPAIFLYSPDFIYVISKNIRGVSIDHLTSPADRFTNAYLWYQKTDNVWKIFVKNN